MLRNLSAVRRQNGLTTAFAAGWDQLSERYHERRFGINTRGVIPSAQLGYTDPALHYYVATDYRSLFVMIRRYATPSAGSFLDYGCGFGRALVIAATFPFSRVIGVELSLPLVETARTNLASAAKRLVCPVREVIHAGADTYAVPDDVTLVYFYNPFSGAVLRATLAQLRASVARLPRRLRLICRVPQVSAFEETVRAAPDLVPHAEVPWSVGVRYLILDLIPTSAHFSSAAATPRPATL